MSRFGAIETSVGTKLAELVTDLVVGSTKMVPADAVFQMVPAVYPGILACIERATIIKFDYQFDRWTQAWEFSLWVAVYASSDGLEIGDARGSAWTIADAVIDKLSGFVPTGYDVDKTSVYPLEPKDIAPFLIDAGRYGILVPFTGKIQFKL